MGTVREYVVGRRLPGDLPEPDKTDTVVPDENGPAEEAAIDLFKVKVGNATAEAIAKGELSSDDFQGIEQGLNSITIGVLLSMEIGQKVSIQVGGYEYFIRLYRERNIPKQAPAKPKVPEASVVVHAAVVRQAKVEVIASMFQYIRENWLYPADQLTVAEKEHRSGYLHAILVAAGVPYAKAGEMRPSREWTGTYQTISIVALDRGVDVREAAAWLVDLPKGEPADPNQPDFAEQIRSEDMPKSEPLGGDTRKDTGHWFDPREVGAGEVIIKGDDA